MATKRTGITGMIGKNPIIRPKKIKAKKVTKKSVKKI